MATDLAVIRNNLIAERQAIDNALAAYDVAEEQTRYDTARATFEAQQNTFNKASRRYQFGQDLINRRIAVQAQIDLITP